MKYLWLMVMVALLGAPLAGQAGGDPENPPEPPDPTAEKESFVMQPASLETGARGEGLRIVANDPSALNTSSSRPPELSFGAGVKLVSGTFQILNQNEAQCTVDVEEDALGTVEVRIELFSVNGTSVLRTLRGSLGIIGETPVGGSQASVGAESVRLVVANSTDAQTAGNVFIKGEVAGTVSITAPTGTTFAEEPVATSTGADINTPSLQSANTVFTFGIGNAALGNVTVRVTNIKYNTALFGLAGGVEGDLSVEITGGALSNQAALVVNAFTARTSIEGENDVPEETPETGSESSASTTDDTGTPVAGGAGIRTGSRNSRGLESSGGRDRDARDEDRARNRPVAPSRTVDSPGGGNVRRVPAPPPSRGPTANPNSSPAGGGGARPVSGGAAGATMGGDGKITTDKARATDEEAEPKEVAEPKELPVSPGLYFCDKDFKPVTAVVLDKMISDEAGGRIWIVLKLDKVKNRDQVDTVTVKLTVDGKPRELVLTETGKNTGEFRCGKEGILIVSNKDPDSNRDAADKQSPPKPRVR